MRVVVIGGGAAGMMAAVAAAREGAEVTLLEKNEKLGKKLYITGKGRCNLTNACDREAFFGHVLRNPRFLYSSFGKWSNWDMMDFIEANGTPCKTERGERAFPASDRSSDVQKALDRALKQAGVRIRLGTRAEELLFTPDEKTVRGVRVSAARGSEELPADRVIVATGGLSYPSTGSTGDGYRMAEAAGHLLTERMPSLVPLEASFAPPLGKSLSCRDLMGLSLKNVAVRFRQSGRELYYDFGEMLFTHFGVSGPVILSASGRLGEALLTEKGRAAGPVSLELDLKPALTAEQLEARFLREAEGQGAKQLGTFLGGWLPRALIPAVLGQAGLAGDRKVAGVSARDRGILLAALKCLKLEIHGLRDYDEAIVTRGGVEVREIEPATMASKRVKGLYFAGEVLDLDAETGGFNLQIAWSTGHAAGRAAAQA